MSTYDDLIGTLLSTGPIDVTDLAARSPLSSADFVGVITSLREDGDIEGDRGLDQLLDKLRESTPTLASALSFAPATLLEDAVDSTPIEVVRAATQGLGLSQPVMIRLSERGFRRATATTRFR